MVLKFLVILMTALRLRLGFQFTMWPRLKRTSALTEERAVQC